MNIFKIKDVKFPKNLCTFNRDILLYIPDQNISLYEKELNIVKGFEETHQNENVFLHKYI